MVIKPALAPDRAVLDPDEDGYVSQKTNSLQLCFATPPSNSVSRNEFHYLYIQEVGSVFDLLRRPNGSIPELIGIDTDGKIGFTQTKANPKAVTGIPGYQAESVNENFLNVSTFNEKGIVFLFAQLCAQGAQLTPLLIPLYKIGKSIFNYSNLSF